jgi:hypothetical protein
VQVHDERVSAAGTVDLDRDADEFELHRAGA